MEALGGASQGHGRPKGSIETLKSGSLRVRVYAGIDQLSRRKLYLTEVIPAGPNAEHQANRIRDQLVEQVVAGRQPKTDATVAQMLDRYLAEWDHSDAFLGTLKSYVRNHVNPLVGEIKARSLNFDALDKFYRELKRCRAHCDGRPFIRHRTAKAHDCDHRCRPHECIGLGASTIRHIHFLLCGAYRRAKKWGWVTDSPMPDAEPPAAPAPAPKPPTARQAALIINEAWRDDEWGVLIWVAMTTGARRGELCALRWSDIDFAPGEETTWIGRGIKKGKTKRWVEGPTKTHQQRRVALDPETVHILSAFSQRIKVRAEELGLDLAEDAFVFSPTPDHSTFYHPETVTQRYDRMVKRLKIRTSLHKLRHYSATQLIRAGVDVRTVAGRIGHGGGGTTTLKVYAAFMSEADQRAAGKFQTRMPQLPAALDRDDRVKADPRYPYEKIAAGLHEAWRRGELGVGTELTENQIAETHGVSAGTAHRVTTLLQRWGVLEIGAGRTNTVQPVPPEQVGEPDAGDEQESDGLQATAGQASGSHLTSPLALVPAQDDDPAAPSRSDDDATATPTSTVRALINLELMHLEATVRTLSVRADPNDFDALERLMLDAVRRTGGDLAEIGEYEMVVRLAGATEPITTVVVAA